MPKWKLSFSLLCLLALVAGFHCMCMAQTARSEEDRRPQIDVEDYQVDAELSPASQQLKAKASVKFTAVDDSVSYVLLEFNSNLRPDRVYLADMGEFIAMNEIYARYFGATKPARATVEVARLPRDVKVEIDVVALA